MKARSSTPSSRIRLLWDSEPRAQGSHVLYWMTATRRPRWNFALDRAVELATELQKPLIVLEALRVDYPWASDRMHAFVLQGMRSNQRAFEGTEVAYHPYVEPTVGAGKGLLAALADEACVVVTDDYPCFFLPAMLAGARLDVRVRFEAVDSNGLLPVRAPERAFSRAFDFRRFLQRELGPHLDRPPRANALARAGLPSLGRLPRQITKRWPSADPALLAGDAAALAALPIDHGVPPVAPEGGAQAGARALAGFLERGLERYAEDRNRLETSATSGLSPYLHFGHVGPHQVLARLASHEGWSTEQLGSITSGKREGWWGMSPSAEAFLDQLVTWRELGLNACVHEPGFGTYESLPGWARTTLAEHAGDEREHVYTLEEFEKGTTHDELWNAAQGELRREGVIQGYLRMLWGKKILHWSESPRRAHEIMVELNNKYALDGRDPNSDSGILWTLGKFDRAWGPERPIFGKVRYMTSDSTWRKMPKKNLGEYVKQYA